MATKTAKTRSAHPTTNFIADNAEIDFIDMSPSFGLRLQLTGDHCIGHLNMDRGKAVELALTILNAADQFAPRFTKEEREQIARIAAGNIHTKRYRAIMDRCYRGEIARADAERLVSEANVLAEAEVEVLAAA